MARAERESDSRRREEKWQTCWCCRDQQRAYRMAQASAEKLEQTGPAEKKRVASKPQKKSWQKRRSCPCKEEKEQSRQSRVPQHEGGEIQGGRERVGSEREHKEEMVDSTVKEGRFQQGKGGQARRASLEVEGSMSG